MSRKKNQHSDKTGLYLAIIGLIGTVTVAALSNWSAIIQIELPINATKTAEARQFTLTLVALQTVINFQPTRTIPTNSPADTLAPNTDIPIPTSTIPPNATTTSTLMPRSITPSETVLIPEGVFTRGDSNGLENERPAASIYVSWFLIDKTEVSNDQYTKCVQAGKCNPPTHLDSTTRRDYFADPTYANYPVIYVTWHDAKAYCEWQSMRLPTEAEWEKAARSDDNRAYPWGNSYSANLLNDLSNHLGDTTSIDSYLEGASRYGVLNMAGNVSEWVYDWANGEYYRVKNSRVDNPQGPAGGIHKIVRGSSFALGDIFNSVVTRRFYALPTDSRADLGFRCVKSSP